MRISYRSNKLEKNLTQDRRLFKEYGNNAKKIKQRVTELESADNLLIIRKLAALRLHPAQREG